MPKDESLVSHWKTAHCKVKQYIIRDNRNYVKGQDPDSKPANLKHHDWI